MKNKKVKKLIIAVIVAAAAVGGIGGGLSYRSSSRTAKVQSVMDLSYSYWGDEVYSSGRVTNDYSQSVYVTSGETIAEVYVEEGQEVHVGDKLLAYDTQAAELNYQAKLLDVEKLKNDIQIAENELKTLKNTKPVSETPEPDPEPVIEPTEPAEPSVPEMDGDAYNYISETAVPYNQDTADGTSENPYRYLCTADCYVTGEFLASLAADGSCAVLEIYDGNEISDEPAASWALDGSSMVLPDADTKWSVATREQLSEEEPDADTQEDADAYEDNSDAGDVQIGYTAAELSTMISEKEQDIKDLDLKKRKAELEVQKLERESTDGVVYASVNGTVKNLQDQENPPADGTAFLEVSGTEGLYVSGAISELLLDTVEPGTMISISSWESGTSTTGEITEISYYPTTTANSSGEGNNNVSYYPFTAYIEDTSGLRNGEYVDMTMTVGSGEDGSSLFIYKAYVRSDEGGNYVYKRDENDRLVKQYLSTGRIADGYAIEILSGITEDDYLAFPYGNTAKEGLACVESDESE